MEIGHDERSETRMDAGRGVSTTFPKVIAHQKTFLETTVEVMTFSICFCSAYRVSLHVDVVRLIYVLIYMFYVSK